MKDKLMTISQKFAKAMVTPVLYLAAIGIFTALCSLLINPDIVSMIPILQNDLVSTVFTVFYKGLLSIFQNLGPIFAIGVAFGLAKKKKEHAGLVSFMCLFVYLATQNGYLSMRDMLVPADALYGSGQAMMLGFQVIDVGVFTGIIIGTIVGLVHNKYCDKDLGEIFSVYGGTRFVFLVSLPIMVALAVLMPILWRPVQDGITATSNLMLNSGGFGYFLFGFLERLLIPTGLHHLIGSPIWYTEIGGTAVVGGETLAGAWNIALAQLTDPTVTELSKVTIFNNINFVKMFGLIGVGLAMISCAKPENKKKAKVIIIPAVLTSVLAGITEPLEFTFLFLNPVLYVCYSAIVGIFFFLLYVLDIVCISAGGVIETLMLNIPVGTAKSNWVQYFMLGFVQIGVMYAFFKFYILKFDVKTPGREDNTEEMKLYTKKDYESQKDTNKTGNAVSTDLGKLIIEGIGGEVNIDTIDNCFTRLRVEVKDLSLVDQELLKTKCQAKGFVLNKKEIQMIYGTNVGKYRKILEDSLSTQIG